MKNAWILTFAILCVCLVSCQSLQDDTSVQAGMDEVVVIPRVSSGSDETPVVEDSVMGDDAQADSAKTDNTDPDDNSSDEFDANTPELVDECVTCHTDKQMLIDTAAQLEVVESENEGEG